MEENKVTTEQTPTVLFVNKEKEPLFSKKNRKLLSDPMDDNNPITVQVLGICSALAITVQLKPAVVMSVSVMAVMAASNVIISLLKFNSQPYSNHCAISSRCFYGYIG